MQRRELKAEGVTYKVGLRKMSHLEVRLVGLQSGYIKLKVKKIRHEKLKRRDYKYDYIIPIKYNFKKPVPKLGSCIFIHLTKNYEPTAGCIALKEKDFLILIRIINKNTKIKIY